jgi:hypothetical protein
MVRRARRERMYRIKSLLRGVVPLAVLHPRARQPGMYEVKTGMRQELIDVSYETSLRETAFLTFYRILGVCTDE